jgi:hypothetical protein
MTFNEVSEQMEEIVTSGFDSGNYSQLGIPKGLDKRQTLAFFKVDVSDDYSDADIESLFLKEVTARLGSMVRKGILKQIAEKRSNVDSPWNDGHHCFKLNPAAYPTETRSLTSSLKHCHIAMRHLVAHCFSNQRAFGEERIFEFARQLIDRDREIGTVETLDGKLPLH